MEIIGKVLGMNTSDGMINIAVGDKDKQIFNIKCLYEEADVYTIYLLKYKKAIHNI